MSLHFRVVWCTVYQVVFLGIRAWYYFTRKREIRVGVLNMPMPYNTGSMMKPGSISGAVFRRSLGRTM